MNSKYLRRKKAQLERQKKLRNIIETISYAVFLALGIWTVSLWGFIAFIENNNLWSYLEPR